MCAELAKRSLPNLFASQYQQRIGVSFRHDPLLANRPAACWVRITHCKTLREWSFDCANQIGVNIAQRACGIWHRLDGRLYRFAVTTIDVGVGSRVESRGLKTKGADHCAGWNKHSLISVIGECHGTARQCAWNVFAASRGNTGLCTYLNLKKGCRNVSGIHVNRCNGRVRHQFDCRVDLLLRGYECHFRAWHKQKNDDENHASQNRCCRDPRHTL